MRRAACDRRSFALHTEFGVGFMASPAPLAVGDTLPADVAAVAAAEGLGEIRIIVKPQRASAGRLIAGFFMIIVGLCLFVVPGFLFAWLVSRYPNFNRKQAARRLYLFENGLIELNAAGAPAAFRWDSMAVLQEIVRKKAYGATIATVYAYTLFKADGSKIKLTGFFENPAAWGQVIQREITRAQLPSAVAALERGEAVHFGDIAVTSQGISTTKRAELPWTEINKIIVRNGQVSVLKAGRMISWTNTQVKNIPNFFVFFALTERFTKPAN